MDRFSDADMATIRRFLDWLSDGWLKSYHNEGLTGYDEGGLTITEYSTDSYGDTERDYRNIPWLALADPTAFAEQLRLEREQIERERRAVEAARMAQNEAAERQVYERLKAKYG